MRRAIGLNLQQSKQTVPHFYVRATIDADPLLAFYREQKTTTGCSLNDLVILAVGRAIAEFPALRSQIVGNEIVEYPHANIGIAVGVDEGLVVPVVLAVDTLSLADLAKATKRVVENGRKGKLENIGKGHFTISNLGMFGVEEFSAIINPPESGILAVSAAREAVIVENGAMRAGRTLTMTLSADHRLVDGVMAAKFIGRLKDLLEHPLGEQGKLA
jgi:pyruvate dehydrogenase E2 component (dihydrolipoamide acetyltransferase)